MTTGGTDIAAYLRGKLHLARIDHTTPLATALDVLMTLVVDVPMETLEDWRKRFDRALLDGSRAKARPGTPAPKAPIPDRATWGLLPEHQAAMKRLANPV